MKLSIVTTLYHSSAYVDEFYARITKEAKKITDDYEIIFVDDGSPDDSLQKAIALYEQDKKVRVIELSRNFGHHKAIMTGLSHAKGDFVFLIDVDLEEEPELLGQFWQELQSEKDLDVVYGVQETRKGGWFEKISGRLFYKFFKLLSNIEMDRNIVTARIFTQKYNKSLTAYKESQLYFMGLSVDVGYKQKALKILKSSDSSTTYTLRKKIALSINSITSFSNKPLMYIFNVGLIITFISFISILRLIFNKIFFSISFEGWTSLIVSIWFFGGLIILFLGIIGIYLSKIFIETKNRPFTVIKNLFEG